MAKGDHKRVQDMVYKQDDRLQAGQENLDNRLNRADDAFYGNYNRGANRDFQTYDNIMNNYQNYFNNPYSPQMGNMGGYSGGGNNMYMGGSNQFNEGFGPSGGMNKGGDQMSQFESALREYQAMNPDAAKQTSGSQLAQYMASKGINISPAMYGNIESGNEVMAPDGSKYKFRVDNGGWYNSSMDDGGGGIGGYGGFNYGGALDKALGGYSDFADTGGYSDKDIADLRARAVSPIRSIYSSAKANLEQARNLSGGYMPNYAGANAQMARHMSQDIGENLNNANAGIAQMRNQGRQFGISGLSGLGQFGMGSADNRMIAGMNARGNALSGMSGLYGTSPGMGGTYGNQLLNSGQNQLAGQQTRQGNASQIIGGLQNSANIPGDFQSAMGNITSAVNLGASIINPMSNFMRPPTTGSPYTIPQQTPVRAIGTY